MGPAALLFFHASLSGDWLRQWLSACRYGSRLPKAKVTGSEIFCVGLPYAASRVAMAELLQMDARQIPYVDEYDMIGPSTCSSTSTKTKPCSPGAGSPLQSHNIRDCGVNKSGNSGESIPNYQVGTARGRGASKMSILSPGQARVNLTRFYGVFAGTPDRANSRFRSEVTPGGRRSQSDPLGKTQAERCRAMNWAQRLKRVFNIGITVTVYLSLD